MLRALRLHFQHAKVLRRFSPTGEEKFQKVTSFTALKCIRNTSHTGGGNTLLKTDYVVLSASGNCGTTCWSAIERIFPPAARFYTLCCCSKPACHPLFPNVVSSQGGGMNPTLKRLLRAAVHLPINHPVGRKAENSSEPSAAPHEKPRVGCRSFCAAPNGTFIHKLESRPPVRMPPPSDVVNWGGHVGRVCGIYIFENVRWLEWDKAGWLDTWWTLAINSAMNW